MDSLLIDTKHNLDQVVPMIKDDLTDAAARVTGKDELCSKCQGLSNDIDQIQKQFDGSKKDFEWATPLSRIIHHADWCQMCRLLLNYALRASKRPSPASGGCSLRKI